MRQPRRVRALAEVLGTRLVDDVLLVLGLDPVVPSRYRDAVALAALYLERELRRPRRSAAAKPTARFGWYRCTRCPWRGERTNVQRRPCPKCGRPDVWDETQKYLTPDLRAHGGR